MTRSLREQARDMDSTRPDPTMFGLYSMRIEGRTLQIQQQALDDLRRQFRAAILTGIRPIEIRIAGGRSRHESMNEIRSDQFIVSRVSDVLGGVDWPSMSIWGLPEQWMKLAQACLRENRYEKAVIALEYAERTSAQASRTLHEAIEGTISGAGRAVTTLEITRDVSIATAGILATVATGGTAGILISTGIGTTATVAQQGMEVHLGLRDRIDWEGITIQTAVGLVTSKFGGQLGNKITARLIGNPAFASVSRRVVSELVGDLTAGKASAALQMAVTNLYNTARGRPDAMNMDQFLDSLAAQLTDPRSAFMDMAMGRVARRAAAGAPAQAPKQKPPATKQQQQTPPPVAAGATTSPVRPSERVGEPVRIPPPSRPLVDARGNPVKPPALPPNRRPRIIVPGQPTAAASRQRLVDAQGQPIRSRPRRGETGLVDPSGRPVSSKPAKPDRRTVELQPAKSAPTQPAPRRDRPGVVLDEFGQQVIPGGRVRREAALKGQPKPLPPGDVVRGQVVEPLVIRQRYPQSDALPPNFLAFDAVQGGNRTPTTSPGRRSGTTIQGERITGGKAISIKSIDVNTGSYRTADGTYRALSGYVDAAADFKSYTLSGGQPPSRVTLVNPAERVVHLELTAPPTPEQMNGFARVQYYGRTRGVTVVIVEPNGNQITGQ